MDKRIKHVVEETTFYFTKTVNIVKNFFTNFIKTMTKNTKDEKIKSKLASPERKAPDPVTKEEMQKNFNELIFFILNDAYEKAEEIEIKTEEDFKVLKNDHFQEMKVKIDKEFDKKTKKLNLEEEISQSQANANMNLAVMMHKRDLIDEIRDEVTKRIEKDLSNEERYTNVLHLLIMEGLYMLLESKVFIRCRKSDIHLVASLIPHCKQIYETISKKPIDIYIDNNSSLPDDCLGGIQLIIEGEKTFLINTLEQRLDQIVYKSVPVIISHLFKQNVHNLQL